MFHHWLVGIFRPLLTEPIKHCLRMVTQPNYLTYQRLLAEFRHAPRFSPRKVRAHGWLLHLPDAASFLSTYQEIFVNQIYAFDSSTQTPKILDLGSNIGLSVLYFKKLYPLAQVIAYEPDPMIFGYLERNIRGNGFQDVELVNKAVWNQPTTLQFHSDGADGGYVTEETRSGLTRVEATDIRDVLEASNFDLVKMDIEGAEFAVLPACRRFLSSIKYILLEYHSRPGYPQRLAQTISILEDSGFRLQMKEVWTSRSPLKEHSANALGFDFQTSIFGFKEPACKGFRESADAPCDGGGLES